MDNKTERAIQKLKKARSLSDILTSLDDAFSYEADSIGDVAQVQFDLIDEAITLLSGADE